jgi:glycerol-3-phosphate dehydrogenase (NAD(P)+)
MDRETLLERARGRGVNPIVYWLLRAIVQPAAHIYFRLSRIGREHIPAEGGFIIAANHRSFLDPFVIALMARRPIYFMTKKEAFINRPAAWLLSSLGAYPIDRGASDQDAMATTKAILERGEGVLIFPEGTRTRPGALGRPKRGVGRLALETGVPVVPVAVIGTEAVRNGWRFRPHKVRIRAGAPLTFPKVEGPSAALAGAVTDRIWPCVELQWEWLGGTPRMRRAAVIGAGAWGTTLAIALARAGLEVDLGTRTAEQAAELTDTRVNSRYLPGVPLPDKIAVHRAADLELPHHDLVCLAVHTRDLPAVVAAHGSKIPARAGVLVLSKGLVAPASSGGTPIVALKGAGRMPARGLALPTAYVAERTESYAVACLGGPGDAGDALAHGASLVAASTDQNFLAQLGDVLAAARLDVQRTTDVTGVELAGAARHAAILAAGAAASAGPNAAGAAAGKVLAEVDAYSRRHGGQPGTFAGLAGAGDLVATVMANGTGQHSTADALDALPLLAAALRKDGADAPAVTGLADVVAGRVEPERWAQTVMKPTRARSSRAA